jgi:uncharacterized protein
MRLLAPDDELVVESVRFPCGRLTLNGRLAYPAAGQLRGAVLIAGPHPLLGGNLENNVVAGLTTALGGRGHVTLSFNFRGVGESEGAAPDVARHLAEFWTTSTIADEPSYRDDLRAAIHFLRDVAGPGMRIALIGYSFGCSLLPHVQCEKGSPLVLIAPTVGTHDYDAFAGVDNPLLVIAPDGDFAADPQRLRSWFDGLNCPKRLERGEWDDHFFRGHENCLAELIANFIDEAWGNHG